MRCRCGALMTWNCDYKYGIFVSWYSCPMCGYDTRNCTYNKYTWSDHTEMESSDADSN